MKLNYDIHDTPKNSGMTWGQLVIFALQQLLAIMAATIAVPAIVGHGMTSSAALFGAGCGTIVYLLFTGFKSPVFLGSSFAFLGSMAAAFAGGVSAEIVALGGGVNNPAGYLGLIIGAVCAGLVYVVLSLIVKFFGTAWIPKLMPAVVIGPTVAIIGLSLAGNAVGDLAGNSAPACNNYICLLCGLVTLAVTMVCSVFGKKTMKLIPFVIGIGAGYVVAAIFTFIGLATENTSLQIINFAPLTSLFEDFKFTSILDYPKFTFLEAFKGDYDYNTVAKLAGNEFSMASYIGTVAVAYIPVAFVVFAEHIADHTNLSTVISNEENTRNLLEDPGLEKTLLGDGVGSMVGAFFGGCPNTTYGESVGCVAITGNASVISILGAAIMAIAISFFSPFVALLSTIPACVMGGVCMALYGFIAVSGLKMVQKVDLEDNRNLFTVSVILIAGIGGLVVNIGPVTITSVACALILGILTNIFLHKGDKNETSGEE